MIRLAFITIINVFEVHVLISPIQNKGSFMEIQKLKEKLYRLIQCNNLGFSTQKNEDIF